MNRHFWNVNGIWATTRVRVSLLASGLLAAAGWVSAAPLPAPDLSLEIVPVWGAQSLNLGEEQGADVAGAPVSISRLDFLLSGVALREESGQWERFDNCMACVRFDRGKGLALIPSVPLKRFTAVRFSIGLGGPVNLAATSGLDATAGKLASLLRPDGVLSCFSMEGRYQRIDGSFGAFGYHLADDGGSVEVEVSLKVEATLSRAIRLAFDVEQIFCGRQPLVIAREGDSLASENGGRLTAKLKANLSAAFRVRSTTTDRQSSLAATQSPTPPATPDSRALRASASQTLSAPNPWRTPVLTL